jgi:hypothetical protein
LLVIPACTILSERCVFVILVLPPALLMFALFLKRKIEWRVSAVYASLIWAMFVALDTELLSAFQLISKPAVAASWVGFTLAALLAVFWSNRKYPDVSEGAGFRSQVRDLSAGDRMLLFGTLALIGLIGVTAFFAAPNTWDAMVYHLPRVFEWMNNRSVGLYATVDHQQLSMSPWSEYAMLHLDILYGGDRLVNFVQWSCYCGCAVVASLIAKELGADLRTQLLAAILCATIPSGVLGASGPKNDCALAYWVIVSAYFLIVWRRDSRWIVAAALGSTMALAAFTKGTAFTYLPFLVVTSFFVWDAAAKRRFVAALPVFGVIALLVLAPWWARNYQLSGSILGPPYFEGVGPVEGRMFANSPLSISATIANVLRNFGLHLGLPNPAANEWTTQFLSQIIRAIGVDPNDPGQVVASQLGYFPQFAVSFWWRHETWTGDPLHLAAFLLAAVLAAFAFRRLDRRILMLGLSVVGGYVLFCALLRWSPWSARYTLALFVLAAPFTALVLVQTLPARAVRTAAWIALIAAAPLALANQSRPLLTKHGIAGGILTVPRDETYFWDQNNRELAPAFSAAARYVQGSACRSIGIDADLLRFEYPMLALLSKDGIPRNIAYSAVKDDTRRFASARQPAFCMVVCLGCARTPEKWQAYGTPPELRRAFYDRIVVLPIGSAAQQSH